MLTCRGISLLEMLLVLAIFGILISIGVEQYRKYESRTVITEVKNDVQQLAHAVNIYFVKTGCAPDGTFPIDRQQPTIQVLANISGINLVTSRDPIVRQYSVRISQQGKTNNGRNIYQLAVIADLNKNYTPAQTLYYAKALNAKNKTGTITPQLVWITPPHTLANNPGNSLWILGGEQQGLKAQQTGSGDQGGTSGSYCVM